MSRYAEVVALFVKPAVSLAQGGAFCVAVRFYHGFPAEAGNRVFSVGMIAMTTVTRPGREDDEVEVEYRQGKKD